MWQDRYPTRARPSQKVHWWEGTTWDIHHAARAAAHGRFNTHTFSFAGTVPFNPPGTSVLATRVSAYVAA